MATTEAITVAGEQTRARYPDETGYVERDGVRVFYEVYGSGEPTVLLLPTWSLIHSRHWKMQIPYLARHCRVVTFDGRGNGRSDRPGGGGVRRARVRGRRARRARRDGDAARGDRRLLARRAARLAARRRASRARRRGSLHRAAFPGGGQPLPRPHAYEFDRELDTDEGWAKYNRYHWLRDYRDFVEFFMSKMFTEPHSTKPIEDAVGWALETDAETLIAKSGRARADPGGGTRPRTRVRCPVLVIHGESDAIASVTRGAAFAEQTGGELVVLEGSGHAPHVRDPVKVNLLLRDFIVPPRPAARWTRGKSRRKRALYISSPIGLGHAQRDVAIADELRKLHPDLEIDWLAQHPVTAGARGARRSDPPRKRAARERVAPHRERVAPSTTCTASRRFVGWTRSCSRTSWSSTISCAMTSTTSGSGTRRGSSTTTSTRTRRRSARRTSG